MQRRDILRMFGCGMAAAAGADLYSLTSTIAHADTTPQQGSVRVRYGAHAGISIFPTVESEQGALIRLLNGVLGTVDAGSPSLALLSSLDRTRVVVYRPGSQEDVTAMIPEAQEFPRASHRYVVTYLRAADNGTELLISASGKSITLINAFDTSPDRQGQLVDIWTKQASSVESFPGFRAAALHRSLDGISVVNLAQWDSEDAWLRMVKAQASQFKQKSPFGQADPHSYRTEAIFGGNRA